MKLGATMAFSHHTKPEFMVQAAQFVESAGFHSIWLPEHVLFFPDYESRYPYTDDGKIAGDPTGVLDPFSALTYIAAHTQTLRLGTGICLVPQRQPVYTAKMVADLDYLSNGRVDFGVGIGWLREEFDNLQMSFAERAARCAEYVQVMRALWAPGVTTFEGPTVTLTPCHFNPKPVQQPGPPIFFGGESDAALRRVATLGDGWYGFNLTPAALAERLARLDELLEQANRSRSELQIFIGPNAQPVTEESLAGYRAAGVDQLIVPVMAGSLDKLQRRADKFVSLMAAA